MADPQNRERFGLRRQSDALVYSFVRKVRPDGTVGYLRQSEADPCTVPSNVVLAKARTHTPQRKCERDSSFQRRMAIGICGYGSRPSPGRR